MHHNQIAQIVIRLSAEQVGADVSKVTAATSYAGDLNYDSLDTINLAMKIEDELGVKIPDAAVDQLKTVGDAIRYVVQHAEARDVK